MSCKMAGKLPCMPMPNALKTEVEKLTTNIFLGTHMLLHFFAY